jgi:hypothetical protein
MRGFEGIKTGEKQFFSHFPAFIIHLIVFNVEHNTTYFPYIARKVEHTTSFPAPSSLYYIFIYIKPGDKLKFALQ